MQKTNNLEIFFQSSCFSPHKLWRDDGLVGRVLVIALAVGLANAFIASSAQAPHLAPRRDCLSPRVPPVVAAYSKKQTDPLNRLFRRIQVRTPTPFT